MIQLWASLADWLTGNLFLALFIRIILSPQTRGILFKNDSALLSMDFKIMRARAERYQPTAPSESEQGITQKNLHYHASTLPEKRITLQNKSYAGYAKTVIYIAFQKQKIITLAIGAKRSFKVE